jgi:hypothetical protein
MINKSSGRKKTKKATTIHKMVRKKGTIEKTYKIQKKNAAEVQNERSTNEHELTKEDAEEVNEPNTDENIGNNEEMTVELNEANTIFK